MFSKGMEAAGTTAGVMDAGALAVIGGTALPVRWDSNRRYQAEIGSKVLRQLNNNLHNTRLPGNSWRVQYPGHFHIWKIFE